MARTVIDLDDEALADAARHKLTVLHQDADFETTARPTGQPVRRIDQ
ncbi:hypothetical protein AB0I39_23175 [Kitasatospora purpeofusca]